uniref:Uncharacterized protein n=1 Tax=Arundo donax TaxID=35708 RepID=A0A0A9CR84_ARUDO
MKIKDFWSSWEGYKFYSETVEGCRINYTNI